MIQRKKITTKSKSKVVKKPTVRKTAVRKTSVRKAPVHKTVRRSTLRATSTTAPFKDMDDVYTYVEKMWITNEKKAYDDSDYEGYLDLIKTCKDVDDLDNELWGDLSTTEWVGEQLGNYIEKAIKRYPHEIYALLKNNPRNKTEMGRAFKRYNITKKDVDDVSYNFILALYQVIQENYVENDVNFRWFDRAMFEYERLIWSAIHKLAKKTPKFKL